MGSYSRAANVGVWWEGGRGTILAPPNTRRFGRLAAGARNLMNQDSQRPEGIRRRTVITGAAWSVPVIAAAIGTPLAAASGSDAGDFILDGSCGSLGILGPGFTLTAGMVPLPVGTIITVSGSGVGDVGAFTVTGGAASVVVVSPTSRRIILTAPLPAGATIDARTTLTLGTDFTMSGGVILPAEYTAGPDAKWIALVNSSVTSCSAT